MLSITCSECRHSFGITSRSFGHSLPCPACKQIMTIPIPVQNLARGHNLLAWAVICLGFVSAIYVVAEMSNGPPTRNSNTSRQTPLQVLRVVPVPAVPVGQQSPPVHHSGTNPLFILRQIKELDQAYFNGFYPGTREQWLAEHMRLEDEYYKIKDK